MAERVVDAEVNIRTFALTYPQLMSQALAQGWGDAELRQLHQAYEVAERMADGLYRAQGMPFICHLVRTASITLAERQPVEVVTAAMLHSAYMLHGFENSCRTKRTRPLRRQLQREIPAAVEALILGYDRLPWRSKDAIARHVEAAESYPPMTRQVLIMRLANELEDYLDLGMVYRSTHPFRKRVHISGDLMVELARRLGRTQLAAELRESYDRCLAASFPETVMRNHRDAYELPGRRWGQMGVMEHWSQMAAGWFSRRGSSQPTRYRFGDVERIFHELDWTHDTTLLELVQQYVEAQRAAGAAARQAFRPYANAAYDVSPEALEAILRDGVQISGIGTEREISNCIPFNFKNVEGAVMDSALTSLRRAVDARVSDRLRALFREGDRLVVRNSGNFWYPPGSCMSWHTNLRTPGWRLYINYVEEPGKSFFRYRDPEGGAIITAADKRWNFRLFKITPRKPLWHAVYSDTNRFSLGYRITLAPSFVERFKGKLVELVS